MDIDLGADKMIPLRTMNFKICICVFLLPRTFGTGYQNANLTAVPAKVVLGDPLLLSCEYNGAANVSAVSWFNGSNSDALILTPGSIAPQCDVFLTINTSYDPTRISYTCDTTSNMYTLGISALGTMDENIKWSCTFLDPLPCPKMAEYTIHLTAQTQLDIIAAQIKEINGTVAQMPKIQAIKINDTDSLTPAVQANEINDTDSLTPAVQTNEINDTDSLTPAIQANEINETGSLTHAIQANEINETGSLTPAIQAIKINETDSLTPALQANDVNVTESKPVIIGVIVGVVLLIVVICCCYQYRHGIKRIIRLAAYVHVTPLYWEAKYKISHNQEARNDVKTENVTTDCACRLLCESSQSNSSGQHEFIV